MEGRTQEFEFDRGLGPRRNWWVRDVGWAHFRFWSVWAKAQQVGWGELVGCSGAGWAHAEG